MEVVPYCNHGNFQQIRDGEETKILRKMRAVFLETNSSKASVVVLLKRKNAPIKR